MVVIGGLNSNNIPNTFNREVVDWIEWDYVFNSGGRDALKKDIMVMLSKEKGESPIAVRVDNLLSEVYKLGLNRRRKEEDLPKRIEKWREGDINDWYISSSSSNDLGLSNSRGFL